MTVLGAIGIAALITAGIYQALDLWVLGSAARKISRTPVTGIEGILGRNGEVAEAFVQARADGPAYGRVRIDGEIWRAKLDGEVSRAVSVGNPVRVVGVSGLALTVVCETPIGSGP